MNDVLIVGCGDIGRRVAALCRGEGQTVTGMMQSAASVAQLQTVGIRPWQADLDDPATLAEARHAGQDIYYFAPPPATGETDPRMANFLAGIADDDLPQRVVYISTTGVYGDCGGAWITEAQPVNPRTPRGKRRLDAENSLRAWQARTGVPVVILRVPGIYGPDRLPLERLKKSLPVLRENEAPYSNRIHAEDLAHVCITAMQRGTPGAVYNVADNQPTTMSHYFNQIADALGLPRPPAVSMAEARAMLTPAMLSFIEESRRIDNRKLREELGVELLYPDLESGLAELKKPTV
ncbi:MAG: SDR family oxidoreductase [Gammaproteobacteria bacterium]